MWKRQVLRLGGCFHDLLKQSGICYNAENRYYRRLKRNTRHPPGSSGQPFTLHADSLYRGAHDHKYQIARLTQGIWTRGSPANDGAEWDDRCHSPETDDRAYWHRLLPGW